MPETVMRTCTGRPPLRIQRGKILLVDEDVGDLLLYTSLLRDQGHSVDGCTTYLEGAERLEREWYDLVILNQEGQTFEGQHLLERAIELDRRRPVLVLTRAVDMRSYLDVMYLGAHDYLEKPPAAWEIVDTVAHCLGPRMASAYAAPRAGQ
jgi:DNA-binding NtrC family response regulator